MPWSCCFPGSISTQFFDTEPSSSYGNQHNCGGAEKDVNVSAGLIQFLEVHAEHGSSKAGLYVDKCKHGDCHIFLDHAAPRGGRCKLPIFT